MGGGGYKVAEVISLKRKGHGGHAGGGAEQKSKVRAGNVNSREKNCTRRERKQQGRGEGGEEEWKINRKWCWFRGRGANNTVTQRNGVAATVAGQLAAPEC